MYSSSTHLVWTRLGILEVRFPSRAWHSRSLLDRTGTEYTRNWACYHTPTLARFLQRSVLSASALLLCSGIFPDRPSPRTRVLPLDSKRPMIMEAARAAAYSHISLFFLCLFIPPEVSTAGDADMVHACNKRQAELARLCVTE